MCGRLQRRGSYEVLVKASLRGLLAAALGRRASSPTGLVRGLGLMEPEALTFRDGARHSHVRPGTSFQTVRWEASGRAGATAVENC